MTLRLVDGGKRDDDDDRPAGDLGPRRLAPGAPRSPGTLPLDLAMHLRSGEALVWWDEKDRVAPRPVLGVVAICVIILLAVTGFSIDFWRQPFASVWPPVAALFSPVLAVLVREVFAMRAIVVTDAAIVDVPRYGEPRRLAVDAIRKVRRDLWTGGVKLEGSGVVIRVPPQLAGDARKAIASSRTTAVRGTAVEDPLRWLP